LLAAVVALAANGYEIRRFVTGGGGARLEATPYVLESTVGQAVAGEVSSATHYLCSGFWCEDAPQRYRVYLPVTQRSN
jgi:hypothetical protein